MWLEELRRTDWHHLKLPLPVLPSPEQPSIGFNESALRGCLAEVRRHPIGTISKADAILAIQAYLVDANRATVDTTTCLMSMMLVNAPLYEEGKYLKSRAHHLRSRPCLWSTRSTTSGSAHRRAQISDLGDGEDQSRRTNHRRPKVRERTFFILTCVQRRHSGIIVSRGSQILELLENWALDPLLH